MAAARPKTSGREEQLRLRLEIAGLRRKLDRRVDRMVDRALLVGGWREYVRNHPSRSLLAAAGAGMVLAVWRRPAGKLSRRFVETALQGAWPDVWRELKRLFAAVPSAADEGRDIAEGAADA